jgi:DNA-binding MarR family transcriptional regulator
VAEALGSKKRSLGCISERDKRATRALSWALEPIANLPRNGRSGIPLSFVTVFLMIAHDEGKGVNTYAREFGVHRSMMSRYLRDIGRRSRNGGRGLGLVSVEPHPVDPQRTQVFLTGKGRSVAKEIFLRLRRAGKAKLFE